MVERVPQSRKAAHVAAIRRLGIADYSIHPEGERETYAPVIQRESYIHHDHTLLGLDTWDNPERRLAMERACDSGMAAITAKVKLAIDKNN